VEKQLIEFSAVAMQRQDFKKTDDMFNRVLGKDHIAVICLMENKETGTRFIIANAHIHWDPAYRDVKLVQTALLIDEIEKIAHNFAKYPPPPPKPSDDTSPTSPPPRPPPHYTDGTKIPLIVCGDFNSIPASGVYEFLSNGSVPYNHADFMSHMYGKYTSEGLRHKLGLKNAYAGTDELSLTNYTPSFQGVIDYIWYSAANVAVNAVLGGVDKSYLEKVVGFPNAHFPSEYVSSFFFACGRKLMDDTLFTSHVCIIGEFRVKPPKDITRPPPVFPSSNVAH
jgi:CCR4-NOT transcription complex subunit 6